MSATFDCLVPFYNEGNKILSVLKTLTKVKDFSQIIAIDDGSTDNVSQQIKKQFPKIKLIQLKKNQGKSAAVKAGLKLVKADYVFLCDADVHNIRLREIKLALKKIIQPDIDLVILKKKDPNPDYWLTNKLTVYSRISCVFSGERVLKTDDLKIIFKRKPQRYQLEAVINQYMIEQHKEARWIDSSIRHPYSYDLGMKMMAEKYTDMTTQIIQGLGVSNFLYQLTNFCTKKA